MTSDSGDDTPAGSGPGPNMRAIEVWDRVIRDMEATVAEYDDAGWDTLQLHPGDVTVAPKANPPGIDAVLPNPEFEALQAHVDTGVTFTEYDVFRAGGEDLEFALLVAKDSARETAVFLPLYYRLRDIAEILGPGDTTTLPLYLRQLDEEAVMLELTEPELLLPEDE